MENNYLDLLCQRRTVYAFKPEAVAQHLVEHALEAATWAPNHHLTEPWVFYVLGPQARKTLAETYGKLRADKRHTPGSEAWQQAYTQAVNRFLAIPGMVLTGQLLTDDPIQRQEDYAAVCCAIQNFQLAMWAQGVGVQWSTGPVIRARETYQLTQTDEKRLRWVGILYYGYPECVPKGKRTCWREKTYFLK